MELGIDVPFTAGVGSTWYRRFEMPARRIAAVDRLGYDYVFVAETGQDCFGPLGYVLAITERVNVGAHVAQVGARSPVAAAIGFQTLDAMAGPERTVIAGFGSSGQVRHEGWHGQPWGSPYWRMRDYVAVVRKVFAGGPLEHHGRTFRVPYDGPDAIGTEPTTVLTEPNPDVPIMCAANTPTMMRLVAEVADGWFAYGFAPGMLPVFSPFLDEGFRRAGHGKSLGTFKLWAHVDVVLTEDVGAAIRPLKRYVARLHRGTPQMAWRGYGDVEVRVQELWSAGRYDEAADAVPDEYVDDAMLVGSPARVVRRLQPWLASGATGLIVRSEDDDAYEIVRRAVPS